MNKKYVVRLAVEERERLRSAVPIGKVASYKIRHANMLLMMDAAGSAFSDEQLCGLSWIRSYHTHRPVIGGRLSDLRHFDISEANVS